MSRAAVEALADLVKAIGYASAETDASGVAMGIDRERWIKRVVPALESARAALSALSAPEASGAQEARHGAVHRLISHAASTRGIAGVSALWVDLASAAREEWDAVHADKGTLAARAERAERAPRRAVAGTSMRCAVCGCLWKRHADGTLSLYDAEQKPGGCCDNASITKLVPHELDEDGDAIARLFAKAKSKRICALTIANASEAIADLRGRAERAEVGVAGAPDGTLPCPACRNLNIGVEVSDRGFAVRCGSLFCEVRGPLRVAQMDAVAEWNALARVTGELAEARERVEDLALRLQTCSNEGDLAIKERNQERTAAARMREALEDVDSVVRDSRGVDGWHRNGDIATWEEVLDAKTIETLAAIAAPRREPLKGDA